MNSAAGMAARAVAGAPAPVPHQPARSGIDLVQAKTPPSNPSLCRGQAAPSRHPFGTLIQKMDLDYVDSDEEREKKKKRRSLKIEENKKNEKKGIDYDYDDELENDDDSDRPPGYGSASSYNDNKSKLRKDIESHGDEYYWVRPIGGKIAIWFKPSVVADTKYEDVSDNRKESKNEGDTGYTWHHTDLFKGTECFMQQVPTSIHSAVSHVGGVSIALNKRR